MFRIIYKLTIVFCIVSPSLSSQNVRKYNIEEEALKLYKQDFKSVLKRFRRTTDYLKILEDKLADIKTANVEMSLQVLHYYQSKMEKKVMDALPPTNKLDDRKNYFRSNAHREAPPPHIPEDDWKKIISLDNCNIFYSQLSLSERNTLREMGFSIAGQAIHTMINNLKSTTENKNEDKYTKLPFGDDIINKFTTLHPENHEWQYIVDGATKHQEPQPLNKEEEPPHPPAPPGEGLVRFSLLEASDRIKAGESGHRAAGLHDALASHNTDRSADVPMNINQTMVKRQAIPMNSFKGTTKSSVLSNWSQSEYSGFSEPTGATRKVLTRIVTFEP